MGEAKGIKIDNTEQYYLIGKYVSTFELIVFQIRFSLSVLFQLQGLKKWKMTEIVFGAKQFTVEPLISCFESICNELLKSIDENIVNEKSDIKPKELLKLISEFKKKFSKQISVRNDLLHGTYIISDMYYGENANEIDTDSLYVFKNTPDKNGARHKVVLEEKQEIVNYIQELDTLYDDFNKLKVKLFILVQDL